MAFDFSKRTQITNPNAYHLGRYGVILGIMSFITGLVTMYTGDLFVPAQAWCVIAVPAVAIGAIMISVSKQKI